MNVASLLFALVAGVSATELTPDNWESETSGKTVFIKFQAPWWGHCKKMKPDWDKLMKEFKGHATVLVGDVDCTAAGKPLCDSNGVKGFPTIKSGDPSDLQAYEGGRDFLALQTHAKGLKPSCSPSNIDLCNDEEKAKIEAIQALSDEDLAAYISDGDKKSADAETLFSAEVEKLQAKYQQLQKDKEDTVAEIKESGLGLHKAVSAQRKKGKAAKEEL